METMKSTQDRPALVRAAIRASVLAGEGRGSRAYLCDVADRVGCSVQDLHINVQTMLGDFMLLRGDIGPDADIGKLRRSRRMFDGGLVYYLAIMS